MFYIWHSKVWMFVIGKVSILIGIMSNHKLISFSEDSTRIEPYALIQAKGAKTAGLSIGYYHFAKPTAGGGADEANFFPNKALQVKPPAHLIPVLDIEVNPNNLTASQFTKWIEDFRTVMQAAGHQKLMIYSYQPFLTSIFNHQQY